MSKDEPLKWSKKKQDARLAQVKLDEHQLIQRKAMSQVGTMWEGFKRKLKAKSRTQQEVIAELHKFMGQVDTLLMKCPETYRATTMELFEDNLARIVATSCGRHGSIHQYIGVGEEFIPQTRQFNTKEELESIPWVKAFMKRPGFVGFATDRNRLLAVYERGIKELPIVGTVIIPKKIRKDFKYPLLQELADAISKSIGESN